MGFATPTAALIAFADLDAEVLSLQLDGYGFRVQRYGSIAELQRARADQGADPLLVAVAGTNDMLVAGRQVSAFTSACPELPLLVASSTATVETAVQLMKQGASDVVALPGGQTLLVSKIRELVDEANRRRGLYAERVTCRSRLASLTPAEVQVLELLLTGMANKQISQQLGIGLRTVELRRSKIMRKMDAKTVAELIKLVCIARGVSDTSVAAS